MIVVKKEEKTYKPLPTAAIKACGNRKVANIAGQKFKRIVLQSTAVRPTVEVDRELETLADEEEQ